MTKQVLFIQGGGGEDGYEVDTALVTSLQTALGKDYYISYPKIQNDESASDFGWCQQIAGLVAAMKANVILVGHSFGASMILKYLSENFIKKRIAGIFLISTPFWSGDEEWKKGLQLPKKFPGKLMRTIPVFFYHSQDDKEIPFSHLTFYRQKLPYATFREIMSGGHQLNNDLTLVAKDIKSLAQQQYSQ